MPKAYLRWKEKLVYEHDEGGDKILVFSAAMGAPAIVACVPSEKAWASMVPEWARNKRTEILEVLKKAEGLDAIEEYDHFEVGTKKG